MNIESELIACAKLGYQRLQSEYKKKICNYLQECQQEDGGFTNIFDKKSDIYYTSFALACFRAMQEKPKHLNSLQRYLSLSFEYTDLAHFGAWIRSVALSKHWIGENIAEHTILCGLREKITEKSVKQTLDKFKTLLRNKSQSTDEILYFYPTIYDNFLSLQIHQLMNWHVSEFWKPLFLVDACKCEQGGISNFEKGIPTISTTVAGLILEQHWKTRSREIDTMWITQRRSYMGGFYASHIALIPDLLSTAIALFYLKVAGTHDPQCVSNIEEFVIAHWSDKHGGFSGGFLFPEESYPDPEYTFYALLTLGAL